MFWSFQTNIITIFTTKICEKCSSSIQCRDLIPQPLEHESPPITNRQGLLPSFGKLAPSCSLHPSSYVTIDFLLLPTYLHTCPPLTKSFKLSVTRFGEILPLKLNFKSLWQVSNDLFSVRQYFEPTLAIFYTIGHIFIAVKGQKLNKLSSCLVTLLSMHNNVFSSGSFF